MQQLGGSGLTVRPVFIPITTGEFSGGSIRNEGREKTTPARSTIREGFSGTRFTGGTGPRAISGGAPRPRGG